MPIEVTPHLLHLITDAGINGTTFSVSSSAMGIASHDHRLLQVARRIKFQPETARFPPVESAPDRAEQTRAVTTLAGGRDGRQAAPIKLRME